MTGQLLDRLYDAALPGLVLLALIVGGFCLLFFFVGGSNHD